MTPFLNKTSLSKSFSLLRSGFQRLIYDASKFVLVLAFFWSICNDSPCKTIVHVVLKVYSWFWTFIWIIMFIQSNFCIWFGFNNVMLTTRTNSFTDNTWFTKFLSFKGNKDHIFLISRYYHSETVVIEFVKFLHKMFWFNFIQFTVGYFSIL